MVSLSIRHDFDRKSSHFPVSASLLASGMVNWHLELHQTYWRPPTDLIETDDQFIIRVEVAGMRDGEFSVSLENNLLSITGVRNDVNERRAFHQMEIHYGEFSTEIELPHLVDIKRITAEYEDGFLRVFLPKAQPKQVIIGD